MGLAQESGLVDSIAETRVIPNGVDTDIFSPGDRAEARAALGLPQNATIVLFSARSAKSSPFKGFEVLEEALPLIARAGAVPDLLLVALGEDSPAAEIEGVPIRFVPFAKDAATVAMYYKAADLYLHPAVAENFPLAVLEAMSCGLPVVASDAGGIPEIVVDGVTGRLFPNRDAVALAEAAVAILSDTSMRTKMASAGRDRVLSDYTLADQVDSYLEWYGELSAATTS
jgi:glycosyltransferase involved in cell wall biosynthesis